MGDRSATASDVEISLTADEGLVLFECLSRFSDSGALKIVDQAEERALWNVCARFQKVLLPPFLKLFAQSGLSTIPQYFR